jgi:phosphoglycolate phosphatase
MKAVLFDLDGVLIDSSTAWWKTINRGRAELGLFEIPERDFRRTFGQGVDADEREFFAGIGVERLIEIYARIFPTQLDSIAVTEGALALLRELGRRGIGRAVVTNTPLGLAREILEAKALAPQVDVLAAATEAADKPAPDLVNLAMSRLGVTPDDCLYVGDSAVDRRASQAAGVRMAGYGIEGDVTLTRLSDVLHHL